MLTVNRNDLPNPHRTCVRNLINGLLVLDNELRRVNHDIRNLQDEFKEEMRRVNFSEFGKSSGSEQDIISFTRQIATIDDVNQCFAKKTEDLEKKRDELTNAARYKISILNTEKFKFKRFHENTIDYLKRFAVNSGDPAVTRNCEKDICEMEKMFMKEVIFIKKSEAALQSFFNLCQLQDMANYCCFKDYDWLPPGKSLNVVEETASNIKDIMGTTMIKALAQLHVQQSSDTKAFLAAYLMNLERNEELIREKLNIFGNPI